MLYWLNLLIGGVWYVFFMGVVWSFLLESRWPNIPRWVPCIVFTAANMIPGIIRSQCGELSLLFHAMGYIQMAITFVFLLGCFRGQWWKKLLAFILYMIVAHLAEGIIFPLFELAGIRYNPDFHSFEFFILQTAICIVAMSLSVVLMFLWNRIEKQRNIPTNAWIFLIIPASQLLMVWNVAEAFWDDYTGTTGTINPLNLY